jgi:urea transport system substrate-binding protein
MPALHERNLVGHMVSWTYLHTMDTPENNAFINEWREFTGDPMATTNDPMEATWLGFQLWIQSVAEAGTTDVQAVRKALAGRSIRAPSGFDILLDAENQHLHKPSVIGRMDEKNVIWPVHISDGLIAPEPWSQWLPKNQGATRQLVLKKAV